MTKCAVIHVSSIDNYNIARDLIQSGLRLSIVAMLTGLSEKWLRKAHHEIKGEAPKTGRMPNNCLYFVKNFQTAGQVSSFVLLYQRLHGTAEPNGKYLLNAMNAYKVLCGDFDINAAFYGCRDVHDGTVLLTYCHTCRTDYLYDRASKYTERCPYCQTQVI